MEHVGGNILYGVQDILLYWGQLRGWRSNILQNVQHIFREEAFGGKYVVESAM
ncbi:hypothetical protein SAMN05216378_4242 [Paenibacillus catalpae]|uniref:Uncharacterized protein n=1 Tax=Paenibacillus catalpae TaxID=1045775 RepID=A0A1I2DRQ8_9BACL|nr:hypothetical protein SAMN05216378_4242 [Paenibacillus catalpae]